MKKSFFVTLIVCACTLSALAQGKGVDQQNGRIRDLSSDRGSGNNGVNQSNGSGRGIDFGRGRTADRPLLPNPFRFSARRDALLQSATELMQERKLIVDSAASKTDQGLLVSQPFTFTKGAVVSESELGRYSDLPPANTRGWTRGRLTYIIDMQPIDALSTNVSINVKLEGRTDGITGAEWVTLQSNGFAEQEFLFSLVEKVNGGVAPAAAR